MNDWIGLVGPNWSRYPPASRQAIQAVEAALGRQFPQDYRRFLRWSDGGMGTPSGHPVSLWSCGTIADWSEFLGVAHYLPNIIGIGTDGDGICYALDYRASSDAPSIVTIDMTQPSPDAPRWLTATFSEAFLVAHDKPLITSGTPPSEAWLRNIAVRWFGRPGARTPAIDWLERRLGLRLPDEYRALLRWSNGGEGQIGGTYLSLWALDEIEWHNRGYQIDRYLPGTLAIGTDGGSKCIAYAFNFDEVPLAMVQADLGNLDPAGLEVLGGSLEGWIASLAERT